MNEEQYKIIKKISDNPELVNEMEKARPGIKSQMSGYLLSPWLPVGLSRKLIMLLILLVAGFGLFFDRHTLVLVLILLPLFSPRIVGEVSWFLGKFKR